MGQSMLKLARVQDQTNHHLQQHIQQGQVNMQAHAGVQHQLATSTHQQNYDTSLQASLYMMEAIEKIFSMARSFGSSMLLLWKGYQN